MLKRVALVLALSFGLVETRIASASELVVGSVRDDDGAPIVDADVRFFDATDAPIASGRTDALGTFAIAPERIARRVEIRCPHCRTASRPIGAETNLAIVVTRYRALESDVASARDIAALPYGNPLDVFALVPFVLGGGAGGGTLSDRGLGGARGLESDDGATLVDLATGASTLARLPDRFEDQFAIVRADRAYRYGTSGGGGVFAVDSLAARTRASFDAGTPASIVVAAGRGRLHSAFGMSGGDGTLGRRADLDLVSEFGGGTLRVGATAASHDLTTISTDSRYVRRGSRIAYATTSRRYRTFASASLDDVVVMGTRDYRSTYATAELRLERPGAVALATGIRATQQSASYAASSGAPYPATGHGNDGTLYVEAESARGRVRAHGALALDGIATSYETAANLRADGKSVYVLPEIDVRIDLGRGAYVGTGYSRAVRMRSLLEIQNAAYRQAGDPFETADLVEGAFGIDSGGRLRAEAIAYREWSHEATPRRLVGVGASLAWQVAPTVSLRAWTLRATHATARASDFDDATRGVLWATYANANAARIDAILHRDVLGTTRALYALDGDIAFPISPHVAFDLGTTRRGNARRFSLGLRSL